ncbi:MAG: hypothetical protein ACON5K_04670, partial [Bacteroidia bacterium]
GEYYQSGSTASSTCYVRDMKGYILVESEGGWQDLNQDLSSNTSFSDSISVHRSELNSLGASLSGLTDSITVHRNQLNTHQTDIDSLYTLMGDSAMPLNYGQSQSTRKTNVSSGDNIASITITTTGGPVLISSYADMQPGGSGGWGRFQLFRGSTALGSEIHSEGAADVNDAISLSLIDNPAAGTYTYYLKVNGVGGSLNVGETDGPLIYAVELKPQNRSTSTSSSVKTTGVAKFYNNTTQTSLSNGTNVNLNSTEANIITGYVTLSSNAIILQPGTYELEGSVGGIIQSSGGGDARAYYAFYNNSTSSYIGQGGISESGNASNHNGMPQTNANAVITVTSTTTIYLKLSSINNLGTISSPADFGVNSLGRAWVVIRKY